MKCWHCDNELIWGGDNDISIEDGYEFDGIVSNLTCPNCPTYVDVYLNLEKIDAKIIN